MIPWWYWVWVATAISIIVAVVISVFMWLVPNCPEGAFAVRRGVGPGFICVQAVEPLP